MAFEPATSPVTCGVLNVMDGATRPLPPLHEDVVSFIREREVALVAGLRRAVGLAPDADRGVAVLALSEARRLQLARWGLRNQAEPGLARDLSLDALEASVDAEAESWDWQTAVSRVTVAAQLEIRFLKALREALHEETIPWLDIVLEEDPPAQELLWSDALKSRVTVRETAIAVLNRCTEALRDRPVLSSSLSHDQTLNLFAKVLESIPGMADEP